VDNVINSLRIRLWRLINNANIRITLKMHLHSARPDGGGGAS